MSSTNYFKFLIFALLIAVFPSCSVEYKLADDFAKNKNKGAVLVLAPETVFTSNLKDSLIIKHPYLSYSQKDTLLQMSNIYLKYIDEKIFVDNSLSFLKDELTKMGFQVYDENSFDQFSYSAFARGYDRSACSFREYVACRRRTDVRGDR